MASCHTHATLSGGAAVSAAPTEHSCTSINSPTEFTEFTEVSGRGYSPTDFTDAHRFLGCVFAPNLCTSVQSVGVFLGGYGILPYPRHPPRGCSCPSCTNQANRAYPPTEFTEFTEASGCVYSPTDFTDAHRWLGCVRFCGFCGKIVWWLRGYGRMPYPPDLCTSVTSVGGS